MLPMYTRQLLFKTVLLRYHEHQILQISLDYGPMLPKPMHTLTHLFEILGFPLTTEGQTLLFLTLINFVP